MTPEFWHQRWLRGDIGWHQAAINPHLQAYWPPAGVMPGAQVLVPLCGKSRDMLWLAGEGYRVLGVEISQAGVEAFFEENDLKPITSHESQFRRYRTDELEILCGDFFALHPSLTRDATAIFDRASLIALPPDMRQAYAEHLKALLPANTSGLLITLDYDQTEKAGPPFAVPPAEVQALLGRQFTLTEIATLDLLAETPRYREQRLSRMLERIYGLSPLTGHTQT